MIRVVDGDTVDLRLDLGLDVSLNVRVRLAGIDAPERGKPGAVEATKWLSEKLRTRVDVLVKTGKARREKYGRYLATIYLLGDVTHINQQMIEAGHARAYEGGQR